MFGRLRPAARGGGEGGGGDDDDGAAEGEEHDYHDGAPSSSPSSAAGEESADASAAAASLAQTVVSTIADGLVHSVAHWRVLLLGQGIALVLAVAGGTNEVLAVECGTSAPSTYNAFGYALIAILGGILHRRDMKKNDGKNDRGNASSEEQESFRGDPGTIGGGGDDDDGDDDDELTLEEDSPTKRSIFSRKAGPAIGQRAKHRTGDASQGSDSKSRPLYPFLFGVFAIRAKWYYYLAVALIEAQAYYLIFVAFRYTSFTFVYVSDALAIPSTMIFTRLLMRRRYLWTHLVGGAICVAGIAVNTASDMSIEGGIEHASSLEHVKGDVFAIVGAVLLGLDDVLSEIIVSDYGGVTEMLFMKGLFGTLISVVQLAIFERDGVRVLFGGDGSSPSSPSASCALSWRMTLFAAHVIARALDVWGEMQFLFVSEAALLNLLLLTSDLYAAVFDVLTEGLAPTPYFYAAFCLIFCGIVLYEAGTSPVERGPSGTTPGAIEFRQREMKIVAPWTSSAETQHAGNPRMNIELT